MQEVKGSDVCKRTISVEKLSPGRTWDFFPAANPGLAIVSLLG